MIDSDINVRNDKDGVGQAGIREKASVQKRKKKSLTSGKSGKRADLY